MDYLIEKAKFFAKTYHHGQRYDGVRLEKEVARIVEVHNRDYFSSHLVPVAEFVEQVYLDNETQQEPKTLHDLICIAYLHDILEDTNCNEIELADEFGREIKNYVCLLTKRESQTYEEYFEDMSQFFPAVFVKLADRILNLSSIQYDKKSSDYFAKRYLGQDKIFREFLIGKVPVNFFKNHCFINLCDLYNIEILRLQKDFKVHDTRHEKNA